MYKVEEVFPPNSLPPPKKSYSQNLEYLVLLLPGRIQGVLENGGIAIKY